MSAAEAAWRRDIAAGVVLDGLLAERAQREREEAELAGCRYPSGPAERQRVKALRLVRRRLQEIDSATEQARGIVRRARAECVAERRAAIFRGDL